MISKGLGCRVREGIQEGFHWTLKEQQSLYRLETLSSSYLLPPNLWSYHGAFLPTGHLSMPLCEPDFLRPLILLIHGSGSTYHLLWSGTTQLTGSSPNLSPISYGWEDRSRPIERQAQNELFLFPMYDAHDFITVIARKLSLYIFSWSLMNHLKTLLRMTPFLNLHAKF